MGLVHTTDDSADHAAPATRVRIVVSTWLAAMAAMAYLCRLSISVAEKTIRGDLGLTEQQMGNILGPAFFWTYAFAQIPSSRLGERLGARISLPLFACAWSIATALFGTVAWYPLLLVIWMIVGLSQAGAFPVATRTISQWYPKSERALASGSLVAFMSAGAAIGAGLTGVLIQYIAWQTLFMLYAAPGLLWALGFYYWFRNRPEGHPAVNSAELRHIHDGESTLHGSTLPDEPTPWSRLVVSWPMWMICGQQFCRAAALVFFGSWFATFLQESRQISVGKSGLLSILPHLATAVACLIGGGVADLIYRRTGRLDWSRKGLAVASLTLSTGLIFAAYFVQDATLAVIVISAGIFCAGLAGPSSYAVTMDMGGRHVGAVFATMNMVGNIGAGLFPMFVPRFRKWLEATPALLDLCAGDSWNAVVVLISLLHLGAAACWLLLPIHGTVIDRSPQGAIGSR
ncbi:MAG: MFS transporter [Planctomycetes bacterium]|nr:MFS transporter [Planctomycetota bacterium]